MAGDSVLQHLVVSIRRGCHELHPLRMQSVPGVEDIVRAQRHVLNALAPVLLNEFLNLIDLIASALVLRLVDGNADFSAGRGKRAAGESRVFAADIKILVLVKIKYAMVEVLEVIHAPLA